MKIAVVAQKLVRGDGQGRAALELVRVLVGAGHRVTVYARELDPDMAERVTFHRLRRPRGPQLVDDLALLVRATRAIRSTRPDLTVVMGHSALAPKPFVYYAQFSHGAWRRTWRKDSRPSWRHRVHALLTLPLERLVARRAAAVLAPSAETVEAIPAPRTAARAVVPNGVDPPELRDPDRTAARHSAGVPDQAIVIGFVGEYFTGRKGLDLLLDAVASGLGDEHVVIAGAGNTRWLQRETRRLGLEGRVHALGFTSPDAVYDASDIVAVPSRYEPFSLVALEAAAAGLPLIVASSVGAAEHLQGAAIVVDSPATSVALRNALNQLRDVEHRRAIGACGQKRASELTWSITASRAAEFVLEVAG